MADMNWGIRDKRGEWKPENSPILSPLFTRPLNIKKILKYYFAPQSFFFPVNFIYILILIFTWNFLTPDLARLETFQLSWILGIYAKNAILLIIVAGSLHLRLYTTKAQGEKYKYTNKWMEKGKNKFLFGNQVWDNMFWSLISGCMIWSAYEALTLWMYANGRLPYIKFSDHPVYLIFLLICSITIIRPAHFYFIHRWSHWKPLYKISHYLHHKNINIGPWTGLSMHPVEHLLYFSVVLVLWIIPSHPIIAIFILMHAALNPARGHSGFHKLVTTDDKGLGNDHYFHYLHHRFFTVNFGNETLPMDKWFGSYHDGSTEAHEKMLAKRQKKKKKRKK